MFARTFNPRQFLLQVYGTESFIDYCAHRSIPFEQVPGWVMREDEYERWQHALRSLPASAQAHVELELAQVNELSQPQSIALLVEAADGRNLPHDSIPSGPAQSLWFLLHQPDLFHEVFLQHEIREVDAWRIAHAPPGLAVDDLERQKATLAESLKAFFRVRDGMGRFCAVDAYRLESSCCFMAYLSDRLQFSGIFADDGTHTVQRVRPAFSVVFVYFPATGRIFLKARQRSRNRILDLFQRFARSVFGITLDERCLMPAYQLDLFKGRFDPLPDAGDMEMVRLKALHLGYPARNGQRRLTLHTNANDDKFAIMELLREHGGSAQVRDQLRVLYAELQVRLRMQGGSKNVLVRLWPDRCNLNQTSLGERLFSCLKRWGITDAV